MGSPRYIQLARYLTHTAVWQITDVGTYGGDTVVTTATTVKCLYYTGNVMRDLGRTTDGVARAIEGVELQHFVLLYSTPTVKVNDLLTAIVNQDSETIAAQVRITKVEAFHGWGDGRGTLLKQCTVEFN